MSQEGASRIGVVGAGTIATGLAADLSRISHVRLVARSSASADRAAKAVAKLGARDPAIDPDRISYGTEAAALTDCTLVVEAIAEELHLKSRLLASLGTVIGPEALLATTTSSLSTEELATLSSVPDRFFALHVFNPVTKMQLVELCFPEQASKSTRELARKLCERLGKTAVEVPDIAGFVVNRLLFPYLFSAVELLEQTELGQAVSSNATPAPRSVKQRP